MEKLNRRERERIARKNDIMKSACHVFAQKGYHKATLDEIAERAEFSKATIYLYFRNKADLFCRLLEDGVKDLNDLIRDVITNDMDPKTQIREILFKIFDYLDSNRDFFRIFWEQRIEINRELHNIESEYDEDLEEEMQTLAVFFEKIFSKALDLGQVNKEFPADLMSSIFLGSTIGIIHLWLNQHPDEPIADKTDLILKILWEGACNKTNEN